MEMLVAITIFAGLAGLSVSVLTRAADSFSRSRAEWAEMQASALLDRQFAVQARIDFRDVAHGSLVGLSVNESMRSLGNAADQLRVVREASVTGALLVRRNDAGRVLSARRLRANAPRACRFDAIGRRCLTVAAQ